MDKPLISWYIKEDEDYIQDNEYYLGSYSSEEDIIINVQVWNNRYGNSDVENIEEGRLAVYFDTIEDSSLLQYCSVSINNGEYITPTIDINRAIVTIGDLYGNYNNGLEDSSNENNFKNLKIKFSKLPTNLKNGLKNLFLDIEFD